MEPIGSSETSASNTQTPGIYPKESRLLEIYQSDKGGLTVIKLMVKVNGQERPYVLKSHIIKNQHGQSVYQQNF